MLLMFFTDDSMRVGETDLSLSAVIDCVAEAGEMIRKAWQKPRHITRKGRIDLVTETDVAVEAMLKKRLGSLLPEADFLAEESSSGLEPEELVPGELTWIIDPLDGTTNFAHGFPFVAVSVALWERGRVVFGAVHAPMLDDMFCAVRGMGAVRNGLPVAVSSTDSLADALVATGFPYAVREHLTPISTELNRVLETTQGIRRPGSAAIDLALTACGVYDAFYERLLKPWDTAAGWLLVEEAGGKVTRYSPPGEYAPGASTILATNSRLHVSMLNLLTAAEKTE